MTTMTHRKPRRPSIGRSATSLLALSVALCAAAPPTLAQDVVNLRLTTLAGNSATGAAAVIDEWNRRNPNIQVTVEAQTDELNWQATAPSTMFAADDGPDLSWWWCSRSFQYKDMIDAGMLAPLDELWDENYPDGTVRYYTEADGHKYAVHVTRVWTPYVYYNKDMFAELGLEPPTEWDDLYEIADTVRAAGHQPMVTLYDYGMVNHLPDGVLMRVLEEDEYYALLNNWAPDSTEEQRAYKWTDANGVRLFEVLAELVERGFASDGFAGLTDDSIARSLFTSGRAAMYQTGSWGGSGQLEQDNFEVGYFYYPPINEEAYGQVGSWLANCFVAFDRGNLDAAKEVLGFIASREGTLLYSEANTAAPGRSDISSEELAEYLPPKIVDMVAEADAAGAPPLFESAVPPDLLNLFKRVVGDVLNGIATPEEAAQEMQNAWEEARNG